MGTVLTGTISRHALQQQQLEVTEDVANGKPSSNMSGTNFTYDENNCYPVTLGQ